MNIWDIVILAVIVLLLAGVIWKLIFDKRNGKGGCHGCIGDCSVCHTTHSDNKNEE